jgi:1-acyl-sn-glycerol-3-phosphate acyltransferase
VSRFEKWLRDVDLRNAGKPSDATRRLAQRVVAPVVRLLWRPTISGTEHFPTDRPFLLVANHSAGVGLAEILSLASLYLDRGTTWATIPIAGFAHPAGFASPAGRWVHRHVGSVPSTRDAALECLSRGISVLVFPGGDHESLSPIWRANQVDFAGRTGFLKLALEAQVPIVPLAIRGGAYTAPIVARGKWLATAFVLPTLLFGVKRWGISAFGLSVAAGILAVTPAPLPVRIFMAWVWLGTPLVFLPIVPWNIRFVVGEPIDLAELSSVEQNDDTAARLRSALSLVERRLQELIDG